MSQFDSSIIRQLLHSMPKQRFQDPKIHQNSDGSYYIRPWVDVITATGRDRVKKTYNLGKSKREAVTKKNEIMKSLNSSGDVIRSQVPFSHVLEEFERSYYGKVQESTAGNYEFQIRKHIKPFFGNMALCDINPLLIQKWLDTLPLAYTSKKVIKGILSKIFCKAQDWNYWKERNPVAAVDLGPEEFKYERKKLTLEQTRQLLAALPYQVRMICMVALFCTLRISEVLGLQEKHLDYEAGVIQVRQRYYRGKMGRTKSKKSTRDVSAGNLMPELKLLCTGDPDRFIFLSDTIRNDHQLRLNWLTPSAKRLGCYCPGFGFHSLRREAVTEYGKSSPFQTMRMAGHSSMDMTLHYTLEERQEQERMVNGFIDRVFPKPN